MTSESPSLPPVPLTPREVVSELDRHIVGQMRAKRAVAIALRNRWRRQQVPAELKDEIAREAVRIAAGICVYTNETIAVEEIEAP